MSTENLAGPSQRPQQQHNTPIQPPKQSMNDVSIKQRGGASPPSPAARGGLQQQRQPRRVPRVCTLLALPRGPLQQRRTAVCTAVARRAKHPGERTTSQTRKRHDDSAGCHCCRNRSRYHVNQVGKDFPFCPFVRRTPSKSRDCARARNAAESGAAIRFSILSEGHRASHETVQEHD